MTAKLNLDTWATELDDITASANAEEREAMDAFKGAMAPYLEQPEHLRTLLSKILAPAVGPEVAETMKTANFKSIDELKSLFKSDVTLVEA